MDRMGDLDVHCGGDVVPQMVFRVLGRQEMANSISLDLAEAPRPTLRHSASTCLES